MDTIAELFKLIGKLFIPISAYFMGEKSEQNKKLKDENEKLKKYSDIDNDKLTNDVYDEQLW